MFEKVVRKIDEYKHPQKIVGAFLLTWLVFNIIQALFTELAHDEAYYWLFSRNLSWGYFDHPPMIALLIKIGCAIFPGELGVRFVPLLMGTATIYLIYLLVKDSLKSTASLLILLSSVIILKSHVGGFLAIPDVPVIFFSVLFMWLYKQYVEQDKAITALLLGLVAAAMLYSKYHGVLVLFFTLISNLQLFRRKTFYIIPVLVIIAMLPHLFWQIQNGFPTFEYHLVSRSSDYKVLFTLDYLLGVVLVGGPLVGLILLYHAHKYKEPGNDFIRAMKFNFYGFFVFFFIMSFKGKVEAHWTAIGFIPAVVLAVNSIYDNKKAFLWLKRLFLPTLIAALLLRFSLVVEIVPSTINVGKEFHNWDTWAQEIKEKSEGRMVVFNGTFQRPAKYSFYSGGDFSHTLNPVWYRKNQFDLWGYTDSIRGQSVALFRGGKPIDTFMTSVSERYNVMYFDDFQYYDNLEVIVAESEIYGMPLDSTYLNVEVVNPTLDTLKLYKEHEKSPRLYLSFYNGKKFYMHQNLSFLDTIIAPSDTIAYRVKFENPEAKGQSTCYVGIINDGLYPGFNGKPFSLTIE